MDAAETAVVEEAIAVGAAPEEGEEETVGNVTIPLGNVGRFFAAGAPKKFALPATPAIPANNIKIDFGGWIIFIATMA